MNCSVIIAKDKTFYKEAFCVLKNIYKGILFCDELLIRIDFSYKFENKRNIWFDIYNNNNTNLEPHEKRCLSDKSRKIYKIPYLCECQSIDIACEVLNSMHKNGLDFIVQDNANKEFIPGNIQPHQIDF